MRNYSVLLLFILLTVFFSGCKKSSSSQSTENTFHDSGLQWTINIPQDMELNDKVSSEPNTSEKETVLLVQDGELNYMEVIKENLLIRDESDYIKSSRQLDRLLFQTFQDKIPTAKIDSVSFVEEIDNLVFQTFLLTINYKNGRVLRSYFYHRLFDHQEFSVNITYVDQKVGEKMIESWRNSTFNS